MCKDSKISEISERLKKGVQIDAPFPSNMEIAYLLLKKEDYKEEKDFLSVETQSENQLTTVKYLKTTNFRKDSEEQTSRHFKITIPDRYVPLKKVLPDNVVRSKEDI